jgi:GMP synthase PP-ATPase subunit
MKLQALNIKKLRKKSIAMIRELLKQHNLKYSVMDDKEKLLNKLAEIQMYSRKIKIYQRYDVSI